MNNPKCPSCGNTRKFVHRTVEFEMCYYGDDGFVYDSKSIEIMDSVVVSCGVCDADMTGEDSE